MASDMDLSGSENGNQKKNAEKVLSDKALSLIYISVGYKVKLSSILPSQSSFTEEM